MKPFRNRPHAWEGCDERMAKAVDALCNECQELNAKGARRLPVKRLIRAHLDPALASIAADFVVGGAAAVKTAFGPAGMSGGYKDLVKLERKIIFFAREKGSRILASIDTLRDALVYIRPFASDRKVVDGEKGLKGASRRRNPQARKTTGIDWPYCELCYRLTQAATEQLYKENVSPEASHARNSHSARYCLEHSYLSGSMYDRDFPRRAKFRRVLQAALDEIRWDDRFKARFRGAAPKDALGSRAGRISSFDLGEFDDFYCRVRHYAYLVAQENTLERNVDIATYRFVHNLSFSEIARKLGITLPAVMQRVRSSRGCFDFNRSDPLLFWWPDTLLCGPGAFKLSPPARRQ